MAVPDSLKHSGLTEEEYLKRSRLGVVRGKELETKVFWALDKAQKQGRISGFVYHLPHSPQDRKGKDFTIFLEKNRSFSFGITTSNKRRGKSAKKHPGINQFYFPFETDPEKILSYLLLFFFSLHYQKSSSSYLKPSSQ